MKTNKMNPVYDGEGALGGKQKIYEFENGYGASVIQGPHTYGGNKGLWELAVLQCGRIDYSTPLTPNHDVLGHLNEGQVKDLLKKIQKLPKKS